MSSRIWVLLAIGGLVLAACGDDDGADVRNVGSDEASGSGSASEPGAASRSAVACEPVGDPSTADAVVDVDLDEWSVTPAPDTTPAGSIDFAAANVGAEPHELVIVQADRVGDLPLDDDGAVDESQLPEGAFVGEIEPFPAGETCDGVFDLEAGGYVLFCNIVEEEDGEVENHFRLGMKTTFAVT
jgi:hypothetical protein